MNRSKPVKSTKWLACVGAAFLAGSATSAMAQLDFGVEPSCPDGGHIRVTWSGATPGGLVGIAWSRRGTGGLAIPNSLPCAGTRLGISRHHAQMVYIGPAGVSGADSIGRVAGPNACNGYMQLIDMSNCDTSDVVDVDA